MPSRRRPDPEPVLTIFPGQVHIGDRFTEADSGDEEREWEVVSRPVTFKKGHEVRARVQRPGEPGMTAREKYWAAHEKITVRRVTAMARPALDVEEPVDVDAMRRELRRLRGEVRRLEEDKGELEKRIAHLQREMEQMRAKGPRGISTS